MKMEYIIDSNVNIDGIQLTLKKIEIDQQYTTISTTISTSSGFPQTKVPTESEIRILATTSTQNYQKVSNWIDGVSTQSLRKYKKDIKLNTIGIYGLMPIDYEFNQYDISMTLSADYINGDLELFNTQMLRKEKLKKLNKICQKYS